MSSSQIMAEIKKKEAELEKLQKTSEQVSDVYEAVDCMSKKFMRAGELMGEAGNIGGKPFDNGAALSMGQNLSTISNNTLALSNQVLANISDLKDEIEKLYAAYRAALAAEAAAAEIEKASKAIVNVTAATTARFVNKR